MQFMTNNTIRSVMLERSTTRRLNLLSHAIGIYLTFLGSNLLQERIISPDKPDSFNNYTFLAFIQYLTSSLFAFVLLIAMKMPIDEKRGSSLYSYFGIALGRFSSNQLGLWSLNFVSYPTLIIARSNKLLPVVVTNYFFFNLRTRLRRLVKIFFMTLGLFMFMYFGSKKRTNNENTLIGTILLVSSLVVEGLTSSMQEFTFKKRKPHFLRMMFFCSIISLILSALLIFPPFSDQLTSSLAIFLRNPHSFFLIILTSFLNACGHCVVFSMIKEHGALSLIIVTSTRKMLSVVFSVFVYGHNINILQWTGILMVFVPMLIGDGR